MAMSEQIKKYLAPFVIQKNTIIEIISLIGNVLDDFSNSMFELKDTIYSGTALKKQINEINIFYKRNDSDEVLRDKLSTSEDILSNRGTEKGIIYDLSCLDNVDYAILKGMGEAGEIVADINPIDDVACCLDMQKMIAIYPQEGLSINNGTKRLITDYIIPIEIKPIFVE